MLVKIGVIQDNAERVIGHLLKVFRKSRSKATMIFLTPFFYPHQREKEGVEDEIDLKIDNI